jgi:hypothetical protein
MPYFSSFPQVFYDSTGTGKNYRLVTDITRKVGFRTNALRNAAFFTRYTIKDGETPEGLAFDLYSRSDLHWVLLLSNNIMDRFHDWPMSTQQFYTFVNEKYTNVNAVHHYEINQTSGDDTKVISIGKDNTDYSSANVVTNFEYEENRQEELRKIKVVKPEFIGLVINEFEDLMTQAVVEGID